MKHDSKTSKFMKLATVKLKINKEECNDYYKNTEPKTSLLPFISIILSLFPKIISLCDNSKESLKDSSLKLKTKNLPIKILL